MKRLFFLTYLLLFFSINITAALGSVDCSHIPNTISSDKSQTHPGNCHQTTMNQNSLEKDGIPQSDKLNENLSNENLSNRESKNGALTFILLIPALLVFVFSGFKKSNK